MSPLFLRALPRRIDVARQRVAATPAEAGELSLEDRAAIESLVAEYAWLVDHGQWSAVPALFAEDAELTADGQVLRGRAAISAWARDRSLKAVRRTAHQVTNVRVRTAGPSRATGTAMLVVHALKTGQREVFIDGVCELHDEFVRTTKGWRFDRRRAVHIADS